MLTKIYCLNTIKSSKIIDSKEEKLANGLIKLTITLSAASLSPNMTINDLAKQLAVLATTVDEGFKKVDIRLTNIENRLGKLETQVAKHSDIFERNGLK